MGLDMYLDIHRHGSSDKSGQITYKHHSGETVVTEAADIKTIVLEGLYWRKANQIHNWFVQECCDGEDDCREHWVPKEKLGELLELCKKVQADHALAEELLPTKAGFFFGSTEYDEDYYHDIDQTIQGIEQLLAKLRPGDSLYYCSSW